VWYVAGVTEPQTPAKEQDGTRSRVPPPIALFSVLALTGSLGIAITSYALGVAWGSPASRAIAVLYMSPPMIAALLVQGPIMRAPIMRPFGIRLSMNRWFLWATFFPLLTALLTIGLSSLLPGVQVAWTSELFLEFHRAGLSEEDFATFSQEIAAGGVHPVVRILLQGVMFGLTAGLLVTLGEEIGWRGFLYSRVQGSFWRRSTIVGVLWGFWYIPLVLLGQFYEDYSAVGAGMIVLWTVVITPQIHYCRARTGSVFAAAIFRGTLMAMVGVPFAMTQGGAPVVVGIHGAVGITASALITLALIIYDKRFAAEPLMTPSAD